MIHQRRPTESPAALVTLTPREKEILVLLATGMSNKTIAQMLVISDDTVHFHLKNIYRKLGVHNRTSATVLVIHGGTISEP